MCWAQELPACVHMVFGDPVCVPTHMCVCVCVCVRVLQRTDPRGPQVGMEALHWCLQDWLVLGGVT